MALSPIIFQQNNMLKTELGIAVVRGNVLYLASEHKNFFWPNKSMKNDVLMYVCVCEREKERQRVFVGHYTYVVMDRERKTGKEPVK